MSLPAPFLDVDQYFEEVLTFLREYSWLYKNPNTDLLVERSCDNFPQKWIPHLRQLSTDDINRIPFGYVNDEWPDDLKVFVNRIESFKAHYTRVKVDKSFKLSKNFFKGLNVKKRHEILAITPLLCEKNISDYVIIDIGAGLGYLSQFIYEQFNCKILAVESDQNKIQKALRCQKLLYADSVDHVKYFHHFVTESSAPILANALRTELGVDVDESKIFLTGLHACADLTVDMLKIFRSAPNIRQMIVLPCCYHRLRQKKDVDKDRFENFPVSSKLRKHYQRGRCDEFLTVPFLRLACQNSAATWRNMTEDDHSVHSENAMKRAVLQLVSVRENCQLSRKKRRSNIKLANNTFATYLSSLYLTHSVTKTGTGQNMLDSQDFRDKMTDVWNEQRHNCELLEALLAFQVSLQSVCENLVLLDRAQLLREWRFECSIVKVMDEAISPRCHAITASK